MNVGCAGHVVRSLAHGHPLLSALNPAVIADRTRIVRSLSLLAPTRGRGRSIVEQAAQASPPIAPSAPLGAQPILQESAPFYGSDSWPARAAGNGHPDARGQPWRPPAACTSPPPAGVGHNWWITQSRSRRSPPVGRECRGASGEPRPQRPTRPVLAADGRGRMNSTSGRIQRDPALLVNRRAAGTGS